MYTLAFDGSMGASGDMLLAALLDAGADPAVLTPVEEALDVEYTIDRTTTGGIDATTVDVRYVADADSHPSGSGDEHSHSQDDQPHESDDAHAHDHAGDSAEGHGPTRTYPEVVAIVEAMELPDTVQNRALAIFERLGEAEAAVHGTDLDATHFHEVGADDAIADVVGAVLLLDDLALDRTVTTPLSTGSGEVEMAHGTASVPAPAVVQIAADADYAIQGGPLERELLTPTGAAILAEIAEGAESLPTMDVTTSGYGAGDHDTGDRANALRAVVGETDGDLRREAITVLETNVDDATPEVLGSLQETLTAVGARDVSILPATMKKARPGHLIKVITKPADADRVARKLAEETGTLGVREHGAGHRWVADRETRTVEIEIAGDTYAIDVKVASDREGTWLDASAEYEDALSVAQETGRPVREIIDRAERSLRE
ncbi:nickel pincer cofactor biosynthesis protein LarC [Halorhabdus sp. CBA1104]|uniref:nickel pincer cofactor biosynthesis protein LarC n=1 Tax=Halorhabdus sp. CBA1104 TaxID=1380432 RepID=UPI0012B4095A|nr:nickel pincer cofactor biosynthesis protein LarC [Halorhabdus sp. CBA1104]QGN07366.1 nickel pincer cofactor biosynthesis protein LarC [Halorhabdus sp. CBA1104]